MKKSFILIFLLSIIVMGCDDPITIKFKHLIRGSNPTELVGDYILHFEEDDMIKEYLLTFSYLGDRTYLFTEAGGDTLYMGRIVRRKGDYYTSGETDEKGYYKISTFRIAGDSIYNAERAFDLDNDEEFLLAGNFFKKYEKVVHDEEHETYYVNNRQRETLKAFQAVNDRAHGIYLKKITEDLDEKVEEAPEQLDNDIESTLDSEIKVDIYPNPFVGEINLELPANTEGKIAVYLLSGQLAAEKEFSGNQVSLDLSELAAGIYAVKVMDSEGNILQTEKVVKR
ncbi:MAG: T9SS type A sorting domain-containing protein [Bacteroidetes bacterium]|nr:T9SS type A sorting domain-containing protein [Bacteroidota bacterium]